MNLPCQEYARASESSRSVATPLAAKASEPSVSDSKIKLPHHKYSRARAYDCAVNPSQIFH